MRRFLGKLYVQVLIGVCAGVALGYFHPSLGVDVKPLGDVFIRLIKMVFAPIIFAMVVLGIARMENNLAEAEKHLQRAHELAPTNGEITAELRAVEGRKPPVKPPDAHPTHRPAQAAPADRRLR